MKWILYLAFFIAIPTSAATKGKAEVNEQKEMAQEQVRLEKEKAQSWTERLEKKLRRRYTTINGNGPIERYAMTCLEKIIDYGNAYYPKAEHGKLYGNIVITFEILSDGHIRAPEVGRSSGHPVLDNFTIRAMRSASPCAPFTDEIRELADIVVVMKTLSYTQKESDIEAKDQPAQINSVQ